jgi:hypothetical protein
MTVALVILLLAAQPAAGQQWLIEPPYGPPAKMNISQQGKPGGAAAPAQNKPDSDSCPDPCTAYDVIVIGSEIEGVLLARAAHDHGKKMLILDPRSRPGGQLIQGQMLVLDEPRDKQHRSLVQGRIKRLYDGYNNRKIRKIEEFEKFYHNLLGPVPIRSGIRITACKTVRKGDVRSLKYIEYRARDGRIHRVTADYWVENTDHAALTGLLKLKRIPGTESLFKGGGPEPEYMAATYMLRFKNVNWAALHDATLKDYPLTNLAKKYGPNTYVDWDFGTGFSFVTEKYEPSSDRLKLRGLNMTYQRDGRVIINALLIFDVDPSDPKSVREAVELGRNEAPDILEFLRGNLPGFGRAKLDELPDYLYIREFDRYETLYVPTRDDLMSSRMFPDNVSIGGYAIDVQATRRIPNGIGLGKPDRYGIPLRSFLLKEIDNVIVAGKNAGAAADAYGSVRILPNTALAGEVIGILIGREEKKLRDLDASDLRRIHDDLEKHYGIRVRG